MNRLLLSLALMTICTSMVFCQHLSGAKFLNYHRTIPDDLVSSKVLVLVSIESHDSLTANERDWKVYAKKAHRYFRKIGIESTSYYYKDDVFASDDAQQAYLKKIESRGIDYICLLSREYTGNQLSDERHVLTFTKFSQNADFISHGQKAYRIDNSDFLKLMVALAKAVKNSGQLSSNFLIEDTPEIVEGQPLDGGDKYMAYNMDLKVSKLAVPKFRPITIPSDLPPGLGNDFLASQLNDYNEGIEALNLKLAQIMSNYPYPYELIDLDMNERELFNKGYHFMLKMLTGRNLSLRNMLEVEESIENPQDLIDDNQYVSKCYIKQLFSKDIYVGSVWDAGKSWEMGLRNYLGELIKNEKK